MTERWPERPYKGLSYYGPADRPLFAGRDGQIRECAELLARFDLTTLVLHGETGCGKSSFLRAGLIPTLEREGFGLEFIKAGRGDDAAAVFIRSTRTPLAELAAALRRFSSSPYQIRTPLGVEEVDLKGAVDDALGDSDLAAARDPEQLLRALRRIADVLPTRLILIIDQAEEVLTLSSPENREHQNDRRAFFRFVRSFNSRPIGVKMLLALRTEYHGRFFDEMYLEHGQQSRIRHFLLPDLRLDGLTEAIERPTSDRPVGNLQPPRSVYRFFYEPRGLASEVARDILSAKAEGAALPLMQIVCRELYDSARSSANKDADFPITEAQYRESGKVGGEVDRHVIASLENACMKAGLTSVSSREIDQWVAVLCELVSIQTDGTVTTRVVPESTVIQDAESRTLHARSTDVLQALADPEVLILRQVADLDERTGLRVPSYSLGHDTIGLALVRLQNRRREEHRARRSRRIQYALGACAAAVAILFAWSGNMQARANIVRLQSQAATVQDADYRLALLLQLEAVRESSKWLAPKLETRVDLRELLVRAPHWSIDIGTWSEDSLRGNKVVGCCPEPGRAVVLDLSALLVAKEARPTVISDSVLPGAPTLTSDGRLVSVETTGPSVEVRLSSGESTTLSLADLSLVENDPLTLFVSGDYLVGVSNLSFGSSAFAVLVDVRDSSSSPTIVPFPYSSGFSYHPSGLAVLFETSPPQLVHLRYGEAVSIIDLPEVDSLVSCNEEWCLLQGSPSYLVPLRSAEGAEIRPIEIFDEPERAPSDRLDPVVSSAVPALVGSEPLILYSGRDGRAELVGGSTESPRHLVGTNAGRIRSTPDGRFLLGRPTDSESTLLVWDLEQVSTDALSDLTLEELDEYACRVAERNLTPDE